MSREQQFDFYWKEIFDGLAYNPIEFNTYRFDQTMSLPGKVNKLYDMFKVLAMNNQEVMDYLKVFVETFDFKLETTIKDVLEVWLNDGKLADIVREAINEEVIEARDGKESLKLRLEADYQSLEEKNNQLSTRLNEFTEIILDTVSKIGDLSIFRDFDPTVMGKMQNEFEERGINAKWFGVVGDGITDDTENIQRAFDYMMSLNKGRLILSGTYKISKPIVIDRISENNIQNIVFTGGGLFVKNPNAFSNAKRMFTLKIGFHDEDNIVFDNLSFDGYDHSINGFDSFNENVAYNSDGTNSSDGNQTKFITFNRCIFKNFYRGMRLSSLSFSFRDCLFQNNIYGFFGNLAFNNNNFFNCQFRRNAVGCHIKQLSSSLGSVQNNFYGCNFESNSNTGLIVDGAYYTLLSGVYFENNGYDYNTLAIQPEEKTHILTRGSVVYFTIQNLFCNYDTDCLILSELSLTHLRVENSTGHKIKTRHIDNSDLGGMLSELVELYNPLTQQSSFTSRGVKYVSYVGKFFNESNIGATYSENYSYSKITPIVTNTPIFSGDFKDGDYLVLLSGFISSVNAGGSYYAVGVIDIKLGVVKKDGSLKLTILENKLESISSNSLVKDTTEISIVNNTLTIKDLNTEAIPDIGQPTRLVLNYEMIVRQKYDSYDSLTTENYIFS